MFLSVLFSLVGGRPGLVKKKPVIYIFTTFEIKRDATCDLFNDVSQLLSNLIKPQLAL